MGGCEVVIASAKGQRGPPPVTKIVPVVQTHTRKVCSVLSVGQRPYRPPGSNPMTIGFRLLS